MKLLKTAAQIAAFAIFLVVLAFFGFYFSVYDSNQDFQDDLRNAKQGLRIEMFKRGYIDKVTQDDARYMYQNSCYRRCHGEAAMITAVLSSAGWFQVVERMRLKENVNISGREVDTIIKYLDEMYPTTVSRYSFEVRKKVHKAVWRNDIGLGDIYTDVIYATPEYLYSIGAEQLIEKYELDKYHVFITSFSVHDGEVELFDLDSLSRLRTADSEAGPGTKWELRFQTADKHHFESIIRFDRNSGTLDGNTGWMELVLEDIGVPEPRVFRWDLPVKYPPGFSLLNEEAAIHSGGNE
jgi:hypothetical protein